MRSALSKQCLADRAQPLAPAILPIHVVREAVGDARPSLDAKVANLLGLRLGLGLERGFPSVVEHQSDVPSAAVRPSLTKTPSIPARAFARVNSSGSNLLRSFPRKRESRGRGPRFWVPASAGTSGCCYLSVRRYFHSGSASLRATSASNSAVNMRSPAFP